MLSLECRRTERTGIPFALAVVHLEELDSALSPDEMERVGTALGAAMRETDITGWYQHLLTVGIILTTLNGADQQTLDSVIVERTRTILSDVVGSRQSGGLRISFHFFPEDGALNEVFHGETEKKDLKRKAPASLKRAMDLTCSLTAVLLLSPLFLIITGLIKMTSKGPVFFRQKRIGQYGKEFTFLKFRSMYVNNDPTIHKEYIQNLINKKVGSSGAYKIKNDPRVTSIGRFLRKSSLDELPQFINVIKGEMSLVGPRPPIPYEVEKYSRWHYRRVLEAKPGITGLWQVHGRSRTTFDDMVRMDLRYIRNQSVWLDLKLLIKTPFAVFKGDGAY